MKKPLLVNINETKGFPRSYRFNPFVRWITIFFALFALVYSVYLIFYRITAENSTFHKMVPFIIIFLTIGTLQRNLFTINLLRFYSDRLEFRYILRPKKVIAWSAFRKLEFLKSKVKAFQITYEETGVKKQYLLPIALPNMLEITNAIIEMCPHMELDEFLKNVVPTEEERTKTSL